MKLKTLVGSGDRIGLFVLPFLAVGLFLNILYPAFFSVGGPTDILKTASILILIPGVALWMWSVALILIEVPRNKLITRGPYALVKHPLYTSVAFLVLPWAGFLFDTWLGVPVGAALYAGSRLYATAEEKAMSETFGPAWKEYVRRVKMPWL